MLTIVSRGDKIVLARNTEVKRASLRELRQMILIKQNKEKREVRIN